MRNRALFRKGFGIDTLMLFGLVVLPALIFIVFLIIEYWKIMRIDNNLKLIANMLAQKAVVLKDFGDYSMFNPILTKAQNYCPNGTTLKATKVANDNNEGVITINVYHQYDGVFFKPKMKASVTNLSYNDLNLTADLECK